MSDNIKEMAQQLRSARWHGTPFSQDAIEAADALEAMASARAECERQYQEKVQEVITQMNRAEAAEAERDRLKTALQDCVDAYDFVIVDEFDRGWSSVSDAIHAARTALGGDAS